MTQTLPTTPYKGTRDFYPDDSIPGTYDFRKRDYIFETWKNFLRARGFEQYDSSILENAQIYIEKSGEELGDSQLYNFEDKGGRKVALRPEMTPTLARMVAHKHREIKFPIRWFSIPNCFRYERPQKGRLREHWQLNVDIIGMEPGEVELELMYILGGLFKEFGAGRQHFKVMYNHRQVLDKWIAINDLNPHKSMLYKILDDWYKVDIQTKKEILAAKLNKSQVELVLDLGEHRGLVFEKYNMIAMEYPELNIIQENISKIHPDLEFVFSPTIVRGIAYYTGLVLEAFDKNPENSRALFGGGRYDDLLDLFGKSAPAVGFGWGDVTMHEFLEGHGLYPDLNKSKNKVGILAINAESLAKIFSQTIPKLLNEGKTYEINYEYFRSENKRIQALSKKGCGDILKI